MQPRKFALWAGVVMLAMGLISLVPAFSGPTRGLPLLTLETSYGAFLTLFPMNIVNKVALIVFGAWGIMAANAKYTSLPASIFYARVVFIVMGLATIFGIVPQTNTVYGYWPLFGGEIVAHGIFALLGGYFGYALSSKVPDSGPAITDFRTPLKGVR